MNATHLLRHRRTAGRETTVNSLEKKQRSKETEWGHLVGHKSQERTGNDVIEEKRWFGHQSQEKRRNDVSQEKRRNDDSKLEDHQSQGKRRITSAKKRGGVMSGR